MTEEIGRTIKDDEVPTGMHMDTGTAVSYTHLDVYKRQVTCTQR